MPLYEYKCQQCGHALEAIQKISDPLFTICPHCGGELKKLISSPAIQFKGSGFYITDYARAGKPEGKESSAEQSSKTETSKSETPKTDPPKKPGSES